jgi:hypothetical protein
MKVICPVLIAAGAWAGVILLIAFLAGCGLRERVTDSFDDGYCRSAAQQGRSYKDCMDRVGASRDGGNINANITHGK